MLWPGGDKNYFPSRPKEIAITYGVARQEVHSSGTIPFLLVYACTAAWSLAPLLNWYYSEKTKHLSHSWSQCIFRSAPPSCPQGVYRLSIYEYLNNKARVRVNPLFFFLCRYADTERKPSVMSTIEIVSITFPVYRCSIVSNSILVPCPTLQQ